ncbi:hypothetical protein NFI96_010456 [Prochilodus magdalenae]|nr:hypothetical protein NFI96_010456 [Prochilodus magdalenae]
MGERVTLTCEIESGDYWNYEWYKNNNLLSDAKRKEYEISNVGQDHAGGYTCKGTQPNGRIYTYTSAAVKLTVSERPNATVKVQPADHVLMGERVTLTCEIESGDYWNYEWYKNNNLLSDAKRKEYEISNVGQDHAGVYTSAGSGSTGVAVGVAVGLSLTVFLIIILSLVYYCRKRTGDSAAQASDVTYTQVVTKKKPKGNNQTVARPNDVTYCEIKIKNMNYVIVTFIITSMMLKLQRYNLTIFYKRGKKLYFAETLFHAHLPSCAYDEVTDDYDVLTIEVLLFHRVEERRRETMADLLSRHLTEFVMTGWPDTSKKLPHSLCPFFAIRDELTVCSGLLLRERPKAAVTEQAKPKATVKFQPADHVLVGERVTLTCEIESGDDWNYEWYKNNNLLSDAKRKEYEISNVGQDHAGVYT